VGVLSAFGAEVEDGSRGEVEFLGDFGAGELLGAENHDLLAEAVPFGLERNTEFGGEGAAGAVAEGFDVVGAVDCFGVAAKNAAVDVEFFADFFLGAVLQKHLLHLGAAGGGAFDLV
jgi:hypothetical protein